MASASRPNIGNAYSVPGSRGASASTEADRAAGTSRSSTTMSWLPVPRSPAVSQVSIRSTAAAGNSTSRTSGRPLGRFRVSPSSSTTQPPMSQSQWSMPLVNGHRPLTRSCSPWRTARPLGANTPPQQRAGCEYTARA